MWDEFVETTCGGDRLLCNVQSNSIVLNQPLFESTEVSLLLGDIHAEKQGLLLGKCVSFLVVYYCVKDPCVVAVPPAKKYFSKKCNKSTRRGISFCQVQKCWHCTQSLPLLLQSQLFHWSQFCNRIL